MSTGDFVNSVEIRESKGHNTSGFYVDVNICKAIGNIRLSICELSIALVLNVTILLSEKQL